MALRAACIRIKKTTHTNRVPWGAGDKGSHYDGRTPHGPVGLAEDRRSGTGYGLLSEKLCETSCRHDPVGSACGRTNKLITHTSRVHRTERVPQCSSKSPSRRPASIWNQNPSPFFYRFAGYSLIHPFIEVQGRVKVRLHSKVGSAQRKWILPSGWVGPPH